MRFLRITRLVPSVGPVGYGARQYRNDRRLTSPGLRLGATGERYDVLVCQRERQEWQKSDKLKFRRLPTSRSHTCGGVAERFKATVLKTVVRASVPWVRIPLPPPETPTFSYTFSVSANRLALLIALYNAFCQDFLKPTFRFGNAKHSIPAAPVHELVSHCHVFRVPQPVHRPVRWQSPTIHVHQLPRQAGVETPRPCRPARGADGVHVKTCYRGEGIGARAGWVKRLHPHVPASPDGQG